MFKDKTELNNLPIKETISVNNKGSTKNLNGENNLKNTKGLLSLPHPSTPSELLFCITNYINMLDGMKGLSTLQKETLLEADEMFTRGQGIIRKSISEIKRKEEGQLHLHFSVRNAFYGVTKAFGEDNDAILAKAKDVALSVGRHLNLPDIEKYVESLEAEYKSSANRQVTVSNAGKETTPKYRIIIDGKIVSEKCRRNNMELARILYKHGVTEGGKSEHCKALGIDITDINNLNDPVEYRVKRKHVKIERIN